jgi:hypothetical protein
MSTAIEYGPATSRCIDTCAECYDVCSQTLTYSLEKQGELLDATHIRQLLDCISTCKLTHDLMLRNSRHHEAACGLCADVCRACAETCSRFQNDEQLSRCAEMCSRCAETCSTMAA